MRWFIYSVLVLLMIYLESTWLANWPLAQLRLNLPWILVMHLAFTYPISVSGPLALLIGFLTDLAATPFLGFFMTVDFVAVVLMRSFIANMFVETLWSRVIWVGLFSMAAYLAEWILLELAGEATALRAFFLTYAPLQSLLTAAVAALILPLLERASKLAYNGV